MKKLIILDALVSMRDMSVRAIPRQVVSILLREKSILIDCVVKCKQKTLFSLNVSFCWMSPLQVNNDVICCLMTSQYATSRKWVLHVNGSPTRRVVNWSKYKSFLINGCLDYENA